MSKPVEVIRCRAALARNGIGVFLLGWMTVAVPVYVLTEGITDGVFATIAGCCLWFIMAGTAIGLAVGLRKRIELSDEGVKLVGSTEETLIPWSDINDMKIGGGQREWIATIRVDGRDITVSALTCMKWGWRPPRSMRRCFDRMYREWRRHVRAGGSP